MICSILQLAEERGIFQRNKKDVETKIIAASIYYAGLSYRKVSEMLSFLEEFSHEAVRDWYLRLQCLFSGEKKERRAIAIDETKTKLEDEQTYVWAAIDVDKKEVVSIYSSRGRSGLNAYLFLKDVLRKCSNKPLFIVDKGPWYPWAFQRLDYRHETFGERNAIESWFSSFKRRTSRFWNRFPYRSSIGSIQRWLKWSLYGIQQLYSQMGR